MPWLLRMTLIVSGIMVISHLYLGWRLTKSVTFLTERKPYAWIPALILCTFYILPVTGFILYGIQGNLDLLEIPKPVTYWFWFGFAFSFQLLSWIIVLDILKIAFKLWSKRNSTATDKIYGKIALLTALAVLVFTGAKMYRNTSVIQTDEIELSLENLPDGLDGYRIIHISDVQGDQYTGQENIRRYAEMVNAQKPDLVIFTGDLISYGTDYIEMSAEALSNIKAPHGVYAVVGDHDYWAGLSNVEPALENRGIELLKDENRLIEAGESRMLLTGITQVYSKRAGEEAVGKLVSDSSRVSLRIMAAHQVSDLLLRESQANDYSLFLAGHTHGGQVRVPVFGMTFSASDLETRYVSGTYQEGGLLINVNNGLGFTLAPVRYNAPPSISVIELTKEE